MHQLRRTRSPAEVSLSKELPRLVFPGLVSLELSIAFRPCLAGEQLRIREREHGDAESHTYPEDSQSIHHRHIPILLGIYPSDSALRAEVTDQQAPREFEF
jgi:hypothetical protein